ncbi:hypothetical protein [Salibacterium qingdaonense]|uniref:Uncharacterized protein n=1 Tax=Salibacterium qingdaonense TaxID=266892 RepID=A0A1I4KZZ1_9BACI|nr:hypothetical protein [Salibacterium qingdaonense]SFL84251.1 hypothetical protein SAMN04488054_10681 [Salibacterium qingdaonense]
MNEKKLEVETLETAKSYAYNLTEGITTFIDYIDRQNFDDAMNLLPAIVEGLEWFMQATYLTLSHQTKYLEYDNFKQYLNDINEALQNNDIILVKDIFEYEVNDKIKEWIQFNFAN